jgi:YbbR domain-containing protein
MVKFDSKQKKLTLGRKKYKLRQKVVVYIFFLALSTVFWLLNALDNDYSTNISFPIKYIHYRPDKEMVGDIPQSLSLNVSGHGYALLRNILTANSHPIIFRVVALKFTEAPNDSGKFYLITRILKENIQRQIGSELIVNYITPDSLQYSFSPVVSKKVPVQADMDIEFTKQYMQEGNIIYQPDSILLTGPQSVLDTIKKIISKKEKVSEVNKSFSRNLRFEKFENVDYKTDKVIATVPVEKFTESTIRIPIRAINVPDSFILKTFPSHISVIYLVSLRNYNKVSSGQFTAIVDYNSAKTSINNKLKIKIDRYPAMIKLVSFNPKNVEYLIEK